MRKESPARSRLPPDYAAAPVCLPSCSPLSLKLCGETGELVAVFPEAVSCRSFAQNFNFHILIPLRNLLLTYWISCAKMLSQNICTAKNAARRAGRWLKCLRNRRFTARQTEYLARKSFKRHRKSRFSVLFCRAKSMPYPLYRQGEERI